MNIPSFGNGNWSWRCPPNALRPELARKLADLCDVTDRHPSFDHPNAHEAAESFAA
jgi:4-alpha-glucanotransferase